MMKYWLLFSKPSRGWVGGLSGSELIAAAYRLMATTAIMQEKGGNVGRWGGERGERCKQQEVRHGWCTR